MGVGRKRKIGGRIKDGLRLRFRLAGVVCMCCMCVFNAYVFSANSKLREMCDFIC